MEGHVVIMGSKIHNMTHNVGGPPSSLIHPLEQCFQNRRIVRVRSQVWHVCMVEVIKQISNVNWRHMEVDIAHKAVPHHIETQLLLHLGFVRHVFPQTESERMMVLM